MTDAVAQSIVVLNPDGKAISANRVALEYTGLSLEEVQATGFRERVFHPDDIARLHETRLRALSGTMPFENEQRVLRADGQYRWFLIQYKPVVDDDGHVACWYATGTDIEDRKRAENKLRQDERELRQLMDALPQHVLVLDKQGALLQEKRPPVRIHQALSRKICERDRLGNRRRAVCPGSHAAHDRNGLESRVARAPRRRSRALVRLHREPRPPEEEKQQSL